MLRKLVNSAPSIWNVTFGHAAAERALQEKIDAMPPATVPPTQIETDFGVSLFEVDRRPGSQVNLIVHGCGVDDADATLIRRKIREAGLSGVTYLMRWDTPTIELEAAKEGFMGLHRASQLAIAVPTVTGLAVATGLALYSALTGFKAGGFAAYEDGLKLARSLAGRFEEVLDAIPEAADGKKVNVLGHSMGAGLVSFALENEKVADRIQDAVLLGNVREETAKVPGRTINVFSTNDQALAHLGETLGNGKVDDDDLEHREVECGHHGYWNLLRSVVPRSWRAPRDVGADSRGRRLPMTRRKTGMRPHEVRLHYKDAA